MKKITTIVIAFFLAVSLFLFSSPTRAIKVGALKQGCVWQEVMNAEFEKVDTVSAFPTKFVYRTDSSLCDELTGSGHSTWYVYRILFVNIPVWAGNG